MQRPWNKAPEVIYSLCTKDKSWIENMNICSYVTPISRKPKKYMIALTPESKTYDNLLLTGYWVLQILSWEDKKYIQKLWKKSWHNVSKLENISKELTEYKNFSVLKSASAAMFIKLSQRISIPEADHDIFIVEIESWTYLNMQSIFLTTQDIYK
jgi:flavin reductase (DIM6/NTAB) family NADH-FMN oxidoreductase RutF